MRPHPSCIACIRNRGGRTLSQQNLCLSCSPRTAGRPLFTAFLGSNGRVLFDALLHPQPRPADDPVVLLETDAAAAQPVRAVPPDRLRKGPRAPAVSAAMTISSL